MTRTWVAKVMCLSGRQGEELLFRQHVTPAFRDTLAWRGHALLHANIPNDFQLVIVEF